MAIASVNVLCPVLQPTGALFARRQRQRAAVFTQDAVVPPMPVRENLQQARCRAARA